MIANQCLLKDFLVSLTFISCILIQNKLKECASLIDKATSSIATYTASIGLWAYVVFGVYKQKL